MRIPKYRKHPNGQAFVQHKSIDRPGNRLYLGKHGTSESRQRYREFINQLTASGGKTVGTDQAKSIQDLIFRYSDYAESYYTDRRELSHMKTVLRSLRDLYGSEAGEDFGPVKLKILREHWVQKGYSRSMCNRYVTRLRRFFRWCVSEELLPASVTQSLESVDPLRKGKSNAKESPPVLPVGIETVQKTLPYVSQTVAAMIQVQYFCGMRPGEVCIMRPCDIRTDDEIWMYLPESHKNSWRNQSLIKAVPPAAQSVLTRFMDREPDEYFFDPRDSIRELQRRRPPRRSREVRDHYDTDSYRKAIVYGLKKAARRGVEIERWSPNQLRHAIYTLIRQRIGADAALHWCGHATLETGDIYFERQLSELARIAQAVDPLLQLDATPEP